MSINLKYSTDVVNDFGKLSDARKRYIQRRADKMYLTSLDGKLANSWSPEIRLNKRLTNYLKVKYEQST